MQTNSSMLELTQHSLQGPSVLRHPHLVQRASSLVADVRRGIAHHEGEVLLAALDYEFPDPEKARSMGSHATLLVSDRRIFGSIHTTNLSPMTMDLPLASVGPVRVERGFLNDAVLVQTTMGEVRIPIWGTALGPYFQAVASVSPAMRTLGPIPIRSSPHDPMGISSACAQLFSGNAIVAAVPRLAFELFQRGACAEDRLRRALVLAVLLDRTLLTGRGMHNGYWLSMFPRKLLALFLASLFGPPRASRQSAEGEQLMFALPDNNNTAQAVASSALGIASSLVLGVGWISIPSRGRGFSALSATLIDLPCGSGVRFDALEGNAMFALPFTAAPLLRSLFAAMTRYEMRFVLGDLACASRMTSEQIIAAPREVLEQAMASAGVRVSLESLFTP